MNTKGEMLYDFGACCKYFVTPKEYFTESEADQARGIRIRTCIAFTPFVFEIFSATGEVSRKELMRNQAQSQDDPIGDAFPRLKHFIFEEGCMFHLGRLDTPFHHAATLINEGGDYLTNSFCG